MSQSCNGPSRAYRGGRIYLYLSGVPDTPLNPTDVDRVYFPPPALPPGVVITYFGTNGNPILIDPVNSLPWYVIQEAPLWIALDFTQAAEFGQHTLQIQAYASTPAQRVAGDVSTPQIHEIKVNVALGPENQSPEIPNRHLWEQMMVKLADKFAPQCIAGGVSTDNWFYDLARCYFQIGDYLRDSAKYREAALGAAASYKQYMEAVQGKVAGYYVFSRGFRMAWERTGDPQWAAAHILLGNAPWVAQGGSPDPNYIRENAFAANYWFDDQFYGRPLSPMFEQCCNFLLGNLDMLYRQNQGKGTVAPNYLPTLPYMAGLAMEPLIEWYWMTGDVRVIDTLRDVCEAIWQNAVNANDGSVLYDMWIPYGEHYCSLNLLIAPAFAWLGRVTGDQTAYQRADFLFSHFNDLEGIDWGGKRFAQNYRWSFDFLAHR